MAKIELKKHEFKKGKSGNPKGRPRKPPGLKDVEKKYPDIRIVILETLNEERGDMTGAQALVNKLMQLGMKGSVDAIRVLLSYAYGNPKTIEPEQSDKELAPPPTIHVHISPDVVKKAEGL